jgi:hypothetical protein
MCIADSSWNAFDWLNAGLRGVHDFGESSLSNQRVVAVATAGWRWRRTGSSRLPQTFRSTSAIREDCGKLVHTRTRTAPCASTLRRNRPVRLLASRLESDCSSSRPVFAFPRYLGKTSRHISMGRFLYNPYSGCCRSMGLAGCYVWKLTRHRALAGALKTGLRNSRELRGSS